MSNPKVMAYRRENGRVGIRNHVIILPLDDLSNSASEKSRLIPRDAKHYRMHTVAFSLEKICNYFFAL